MKINRIFTLVGKLDRLIEWLEVVVVASSVVAMAINCIANVIARYLFSYSLYFTEELNQYLMVLITFIGLSYVTRKGRHIRMSAIYDTLDDQIKKGVMLVICLSTAFIMFLLAYYSYEYIVKLAMRGKVSPALRVPVYLTMICLPVGFVLTGIQYLLAIVQNLRSEHVYLSYTRVDTYDSDEVEVEMTSNAELSALSGEAQTVQNNAFNNATRSVADNTEEN